MEQQSENSDSNLAVSFVLNIVKAKTQEYNNKIIDKVKQLEKKQQSAVPQINMSNYNEYHQKSQLNRTDSGRRRNSPTNASNQMQHEMNSRHYDNQNNMRQQFMRGQPNQNQRQSFRNQSYEDMDREKISHGTHHDGGNFNRQRYDDQHNQNRRYMHDNRYDGQNNSSQRGYDRMKEQPHMQKFSSDQRFDRNGYEIWVHNVDFEMTANQVVNKFRHCGEILKWNFPRKDPSQQNHGRHRGYGFIYFKTKEGQQNAFRMRHDPPMIGARQIVIGMNNNQPRPMNQYGHPMNPHHQNQQYGNNMQRRHSQNENFQYHQRGPNMRNYGQQKQDMNQHQDHYNENYYDDRNFDHQHNQRQNNNHPNFQKRERVYSLGNEYNQRSPRNEREKDQRNYSHDKNDEKSRSLQQNDEIAEELSIQKADQNANQSKSFSEQQEEQSQGQNVREIRDNISYNNSLQDSLKSVERQEEIDDDKNEDEIAKLNPEKSGKNLRELIGGVGNADSAASNHNIESVDKKQAVSRASAQPNTKETATKEIKVESDIKTEKQKTPENDLKCNQTIGSNDKISAPISTKKEEQEDGNHEDEENNSLKQENEQKNQNWQEQSDDGYDDFQNSENWNDKRQVRQRVYDLPSDQRNDENQGRRHDNFKRNFDRSNENRNRDDYREDNQNYHRNDRQMKQFQPNMSSDRLNPNNRNFIGYEKKAEYEKMKENKREEMYMRRQASNDKFNQQSQESEGRYRDDRNYNDFRRNSFNQQRGQMNERNQRQNYERQYGQQNYHQGYQHRQNFQQQRNNRDGYGNMNQQNQGYVESRGGNFNDQNQEYRMVGGKRQYHTMRNDSYDNKPYIHQNYQPNTFKRQRNDFNDRQQDQFQRPSSRASGSENDFYRRNNNSRENFMNPNYQKYQRKPDGNQPNNHQSGGYREYKQDDYKNRNFKQRNYNGNSPDNYQNQQSEFQNDNIKTSQISDQRLDKSQNQQYFNKRENLNFNYNIGNEIFDKRKVSQIEDYYGYNDDQAFDPQQDNIREGEDDSDNFDFDKKSLTFHDTLIEDQFSKRKSMKKSTSQKNWKS